MCRRGFPMELAVLCAERIDIHPGQRIDIVSEPLPWRNRLVMWLIRNLTVQ
jgi:hypothetical protein